MGEQAFDMVDIIRAKRDARTLSAEQIRWWVGSYARGELPDEQVAALLMAVVWRGMDPGEVVALTRAMVESGERLSLQDLSRPTVDKHSTGGVGDTVSLILAPLVAACGAAVPQLSGRGLGHTGGTLDKLEAIPGMRVNLSPEEALSVLGDVGCVICAAGPGLAPADRRLYALRDVTATVESVPLIASSIMAKKIAEGTGALALDVKVGTGAFLPDRDTARRLAETMVELGSAAGVRTAALLTRMDTPLGRAAGNALEVAEALAVLSGERPPTDPLKEVTLRLAEEMLALVGLPPEQAEKALDTGAALDRWRAMVAAQGGDPDAPLPTASHRQVVTARQAGWLRVLDARAVGVAAWRLGAGRARKEDPVDPAAGVVCLAGPGEWVEEGQPLVELHTSDPRRFERAEEALGGGIEIGPERPELGPWVLEHMGG
jgi:thymidine phosphorylase